MKNLETVLEMDLILREDLKKERLPGRIIQSAVGKTGLSSSSRMTIGFAHYSEESGPMQPHHHAEEVVYILDSRDGWVRHGPAADKLGPRIPLKTGMTLHFPELEWHVFEYASSGYVDIIFCYAQTDNLR